MLTLAAPLWAQQATSAGPLEKGKQLLTTGRYQAAKQHFLTLATGQNLSLQPMSAFYVGVCLYKEEAYAQAMTYFAQVQADYPDFPLQEALLFWQGLCAVQMGEPYMAFDYFSQLHSTRYKLQANAVTTAPLNNAAQQKAQLPLLAQLYQKYPDEHIADKLQEALKLHIAPEEDQHTIERLFEEEWAQQKAHELLHAARMRQQQQQHVVVLLPFFFSNTWQIDSTRQKVSFVWSLYQGLCSAQRTLANANIDIQLHPYDTRRNTHDTQQLLNQLKDKDIDLIIGPLYWEAIAPVQAFAEEAGIPLINPLSSNPKLTEILENTWLFQANTLRKASAAAQYTQEQLSHKPAAIFCEILPQNITLCEAYTKHLRDAGIHIVLEKYLAKKEAHTIRDVLTVVERTPLKDIPINSTPPEEAGFLFKKGTGKYGGQKEIWYKEKWYIQPDSIGHIFIAATHPSFFSYAISAIQQRPDNIPLLTEEQWLLQKNLDYAQIERLQVRFIANNHMPTQSLPMQAFVKNFLTRWGQMPDKHACIGYELLLLMGKNMYRYGDNFMQKLQQAPYQKGQLGACIHYVPGKKDNQVVRILQLQHGQLVPTHTYGNEK